jgi:hypothetical protein
MMKSILFGSLVTVFAFACGGGGSGGSGVDGGKRLVDLSDSEITELCEFAFAADPEREITCSDGTVTVGQASVAECVQEANESAAAAPNCPVTVSQYEACISALGDQSDADLCEFNFPAACAPLLQEACLGE